MTEQSSDGILGGLHRYRYPGSPGDFLLLDDVAEVLRSDEAVETYVTAAQEHLVVTNGLKPGTFFEDRLKCVACGPVDDHEHSVHMGLAALAGGDQ